MCRAWDGDENQRAAEAFHRASGLSDDFEYAVECETLGQLFDLKTSSDSVLLREVQFPIRSASKVLGLLDGDDRLSRAPADRNRKRASSWIAVAGEFIVRNKPLPSEAGSGPIGSRRLSLSVAGDARDLRRHSPRRGVRRAAYLRGYAGEAFDSALALVERLAGDEAAGHPVVSEN